MFPMPKDVPLSESLFSKPTLLCSIAAISRRQHQELLCFHHHHKKTVKKTSLQMGLQGGDNEVGTHQNTNNDNDGHNLFFALPL